MKKLSKISFKNTLNEEQMKHVVGGTSNTNCGNGPTTGGCDGLCAPSVGTDGNFTVRKCKMYYIQGLGGGKVPVCGCF